MTRRRPSTKAIPISRSRPRNRSKSACDVRPARSDLRQPPTTRASTDSYSDSSPEIPASDTGACGPGVGDLNEALYAQANAIFRGGEFQSQWDIVPVGDGFFGIESQFDVVRATFTDGTNVPRIPPVRVGGGIYWRDDAWLARVRLLHAFAQNDIAPVAETPTPGYDDLRAEVSYTRKVAKPNRDELSEMTFGLTGTNLLNQDIRNSVSYTKDQVLLPGAAVRLFARLKY